MSARRGEPLNWGGGQEMTELESTMWRANRHPENSTQGGVLELLDGTPDWETVRSWHAYGLSEYPRFRQKVVEPAIPVGPPVWVDDPDFDLDHHLHRVWLSGSATVDDVLETATSWALRQLAPHRPPWRGVFIEGLDGGRSAYFLVVHHCLMDGHGSVQLLGDLHTRSAALADAHTPAVPAGSAPPTRWSVARSQVVDRVRQVPAGTMRAARVTLDAVRDRSETSEFLGSVKRVLAPPPPSTSPLLAGGARTNWRYGILDCDLAALRSAAKSVGGTINDAYVCSILGGLRRYHEKQGLAMGDAVVNMPVSVRRAGDLEGGNRFAAAFISAPGSIVDPAQRMRALREVVAQVSSEPALDFFSLVLPVLNRAPARVLTPLFTSMQNRTDVTISNVPGMRTQARFLGVPVEGIYYFGPLPGSPVMVVLYSHAGRAHIGVNCDGDVFDSRELMACLREGLDEILALAGDAGEPQR